jgi:MFS family permease
MDKKTKKRWPVAVWVVVVLIAVVNYTLLGLSYATFPDPATFWQEVIWRSIALVFATVGALIVSRDRKHVIGWLLMVTPIMITLGTILAFFFEPRLETATALDAGLFLYVWFNSWSWWLLIGPIILIFYLFPTGHLISKNWRWGVISLGLAFSIFLFVATFASETEELDGTRIFANPIGFLSNSLVESLVSIMSLFLVVGAVISLIAVFVRYRRSQATERAQLRWLFIACSLFVVNYTVAFALPDYTETTFNNAIFLLTVVFIPISIGIAILRYRLWDVDVVINRSLVYAVLTTLLASLFAGTAALLSQLAKAAFGEEMQQAAAAVAAIVVASLFTPVRTWVETGINRRLFPENIDLSQGLIELNSNLWNWFSLPRILDSTLEHLEAIYGHEVGAIYLRNTLADYRPAAARGIAKNELTPYLPNSAEQDALMHKKGILDDSAKPFVLTVPIYLARRKAPELIGVLRLGKRKQGRGYSGGDLKTLAGFGSKLGEPIYALSVEKRN